MHNSTAKSYKDTCKQQESAHQWGFGSIAQISDAAVELTLGDFALFIKIQIAAEIFVTVSFGLTSLVEKFKLVWSVTISFHTAHFIRPGCRTILFIMVCSTVIPTLKRLTLVALEAVSCETKQIVVIQY